MAIGSRLRTRTAGATVVAAFAAGVLILVLAFAVRINASAPTATTETPNSGFVQTPGGAIPDRLPAGCYVGTLNPFTITQVPCMTNLSPIGTPILHVSSSEGMPFPAKW